MYGSATENCQSLSSSKCALHNVHVHVLCLAKINGQECNKKGRICTCDIVLTGLCRFTIHFSLHTQHIYLQITHAPSIPHHRVIV